MKYEDADIDTQRKVTTAVRRLFRELTIDKKLHNYDYTCWDEKFINDIAWGGSLGELGGWGRLSSKQIWAVDRIVVRYDLSRLINDIYKAGDNYQG